MRELSLHILDLVQNSITARASLIELGIEENMDEDKLMIQIKDNGCGMDQETLSKIADPFYTTRTTRRVGLGIPLMKAACQRCKGDLTITSEVGKGTVLTAWLQHSNIDRAPLGNIVDTMITLLMADEKIDYIYTHTYQKATFIFDTREVKQIIGDQASLLENAVLLWIREYLEEGIKSINGGAV